MEVLQKEIAGFENYVVYSDGRIWSKCAGKFMKTAIVTGYLRVGLWKDGIDRKFLVHRLIAEAFIPNPDGKPQVNHKDGNKQNNTVSNLEWVTATENQRHAYATGLKRIKRGERHGNSKLTEANVIDIRERYATGGVMQKELAEEFGLGKTQVSQIVRRLQWKHVA